MRKQEQKGKITALYERLSHDDGRSDESVSVENQKRILEDYARKNGFTNVRISRVRRRITSGTTIGLVTLLAR